jgi:hypothetical protein
MTKRQLKYLFELTDEEIGHRYCVVNKARALIKAMWNVTLSVENKEHLKSAIDGCDKYLSSIEKIVGERECKARAIEAQDGEGE